MGQHHRSGRAARRPLRAVRGGLSLIFGVMRIVNIAHGDLIVVAAYMAYFIMQMMGVGPFTSLLVVVPVIAVFGYALQRGLLNFTLGDELPPCFVTLGLSVIIQNVLLISVHRRQPQARCRADRDRELENQERIGDRALPVIQFATAVADHRRAATPLLPHRHRPRLSRHLRRPGDRPTDGHRDPAYLRARHGAVARGRGGGRRVHRASARISTRSPGRCC